MSKTFTYSKLKINTDNPKKWYISYTIKYDDNKTVYAKIYGGEYLIRLNDFENDTEHIAKAEKLLKKVKKDLDLGQDPKSKTEDLKKQLYEEHLKAQGVTYDEAVQIMIEYHNWDNPAPAQKITAYNQKIFYNAEFRRYVHEIGKTDDVTKITTDDILNYILRHNNPRGAEYLYPVDGKVYPVGTWSISTCVSKLGNLGYFFTPLLEKRKIETNPLRAITNIKKKLKRTTVQKPKQNRYELWTESELVEFDKVLNTDKFMLHYAIGMCCYHAYIRNSEVLRITLDMIDLENKRFVLDSDITKGHNKYDSSTRIFLKMNDDLVNILTKYLDCKFGEDRQPNYYLFPSIRHKHIPYDYHQYAKDYKEKCASLLTSKKLPYSLKHTGVTKYWNENAKAGVAPAVLITRLMKMCRHSNFNETMRYISTDLGIDIDID
ncbi:MAG: site-specific integrase [Pedobacter sp.]|nr:MAG: site-specific integrase [Pedobacter sp.]